MLKDGTCAPSEGDKSAFQTMAVADRAEIDDTAKAGTLNMKDGSNLASADTIVRSISEFDSTNGGS
jgi:hypothetical protein